MLQPWCASVGIPGCGSLIPCLRLAPRGWHSGRVQRRVHRDRLQRRIARPVAPSQLSELENHLPPAVLQHLAARVRLGLGLGLWLGSGFGFGFGFG